ncbi:MAG: hypothetical protein ABI970_07135, partial [Chloroflexota bacterium]
QEVHFGIGIIQIISQFDATGGVQNCCAGILRFDHQYGKRIQDLQDMIRLIEFFVGGQRLGLGADGFIIHTAIGF